MNNKQARDIRLDAIKGVTAILVVIGHCIQHGSGHAYIINRTFFENQIFKFIYTFHMPLFMLLSGYLSYNSLKKRDGFIFLKKRISSLIVPIVFWGFMDFILDFKDKEYYKLGKIPFLKEVYWHIMGSLWFLWALIFCTAVVVVIRTYFKDSYIIYGLLLIVMLFITDNYNLGWFKFMYPYFVMGYLYNKNKDHGIWKLDTKYKHILAFLCAVLLYMWLFPQYGYDTFIYNSYITIRKKADVLYQLKVDFIRWGIGFAGSVAAIYFVVWGIGKIQLIQKALAEIGKKSLGIYITSIYVNLYLLQPIAKEWTYNFGIALVESLFILPICMGITIMIEKNYYTNRLMLGGTKRSRK